MEQSRNSSLYTVSLKLLGVEAKNSKKSQLRNVLIRRKWPHSFQINNKINRSVLSNYKWEDELENDLKFLAAIVCILWRKSHLNFQNCIVLNLQNFYENLLRIDGPNSLDNFGVNNLVISLLKKYVPTERFTI